MSALFLVSRMLAAVYCVETRIHTIYQRTSRYETQSISSNVNIYLLCRANYFGSPTQPEPRQLQIPVMNRENKIPIAASYNINGFLVANVSLIQSPSYETASSQQEVGLTK